MATRSLSYECSTGPLKIGPLELPHEANHAACPVKQVTPGVLGGWYCSCPCHHTAQP